MGEIEIGIIGGSGLYRMEGLTVREERRLETPFGEPSDAYVLGELEGRSVPGAPRPGPPAAAVGAQLPGEPA